MERNREARRGSMAAAASNGGGGGLSRRRPRNSNSFRESPEEDGRMEIPESSRLRDRGAKKDRDRDRSSRSRRRRGERLLHGSSRDRDEGDESSEESMDQEDEDEDEDLSVPVRLPPSSSPPSNPAAASSPQLNSSHNHHHHHHHHQQQLPRKSFPPKAVKWKADEMIGVPVPRKARSVSTKRSPHEHPASGGGGGGGAGEQIARQASTSPSRMSPASATQLSPTSSNGSLRRKMKPISTSKQRPPKFSKTASLSQDEIEIEVAEVLFGLTRQFECLPKQESYKLDARDMDGGSGNEAKSRVSSPTSLSPSPAAYQSAFPSTNSSSNPAPLPTIAPKRKRPRPVKLDEESPTSPVGLHNLSSLSLPSVTKMEAESQAKAEASSPKSERSSSNPAVKSGGDSVDVVVSQTGLSDAQQQESAKAEKSKIQDLHPGTGGAAGTGDTVENKAEPVSSAKGDVDVNLSEATARKIASDCHKEEKFKIDLMAPPPGKQSPEGDDFNNLDPDQKSLGPDTEMALQANEERAEEKPADSVVMRDEQQVEKPAKKNVEVKKQAVAKQNLEYQLDLEKSKKDDAGLDKMQVHKHHSKDPKVDSKQEKSASSLHMPLTVGAWPGGFPPYGYMGQVPPLQAVVPMDGSSGPSSLQSPPFLQMHPRPKRCATHCYVAQMISNHQKFAKMNSFWTAAAGAAAPFYGAKPPYSSNVVSPPDAALAGNPLQGSFLGPNAGTLHDPKGTPTLAASYIGHSNAQEKMLLANNSIMEATQRKQLIIQQMPQTGSASNVPGPAFIFPINQQQAAAAATAAAAAATAAAAAAAANRAGAAKSPGSGAEVRTSGAMNAAVGNGGGGGSATTVNLNFAGLPPNDAQYVAFLQNNGYPFPIPAQFAGPPFRGTSNAQPMPFFYPSHMLHPTQLRQPQQQPAGALPHVQQNHPNQSTLNCSSSQKHSQPSSNGFPTTNQRHDQLAQQTRPKEGNKAMEDNPQNLALMSTVAAAMHMGNGGGHGDKQPIYQQTQPKHNMKVELIPPQAFTIPFASFGGAVNAPPGLDFSSMAQNHAILQSLPEASRHGFYQMATAAVGATAQATEQKKGYQVPEDGKPVARESMNTNMAAEEDRKASKPTQHSLSFTKTDGESPISSVICNSILDMSSRAGNLIQPANGSRSADRSTGTAAATTAAVSANSHQQSQKHLIHLPKHQQQQLQMQQRHLASARSKHSASGNSNSAHSDSLSGSSAISKFPHPLTGFPPAHVQGGSPIQWLQGKTSAGRGSDPSAASPASVMKNNILQLQGRASQQSLPAQSHQTQISFGVNATKVVAPGHLPGACGSPSPSAAAVAVASPSNSISKSTGGSPSPSPSVKPGPQSSAILLSQSAIKQSASSSNSKSNVSNPNMPSILGPPQKVAVPSPGNKQQQQQLQQPKQQSFPEAQLFFSNPHLQQVQCAQSNASAQYYQKRQSEQTRPTQQQQQQHNSLCGPSALTLAGVPTPSDPAKAMAANSAAAASNLKGLPQPSFLNAAQLAVAAQSASGSPRPPIPATFSYMPLPPYSVKPSAEQKPAAGSDNLHACWQPEKR